MFLDTKKATVNVRTRTLSLFLFFTSRVQMKSLTTRMGNCSTAVGKKIENMTGIENLDRRHIDKQ